MRMMGEKHLFSHSLIDFCGGLRGSGGAKNHTGTGLAATAANKTTNYISSKIICNAQQRHTLHHIRGEDQTGTFQHFSFTRE